MSAEHTPHSGLPDSDNRDVLAIYYGIHDALRELGDADADVGETPTPPREAVISGLWDASSGLSRLIEQYEDLAVRADERIKMIDEADDRTERMRVKYAELKEQLEMCEQSRNLLTTEVGGLMEQLEATRDALSHVIDEGIDRWHDSGDGDSAPDGGDVGLPEWLGMSDDEYRVWVERGLDAYVAARASSPASRPD